MKIKSLIFNSNFGCNPFDRGQMDGRNTGFNRSSKSSSKTKEAGTA